MQAAAAAVCLLPVAPGRAQHPRPGWQAGLVRGEGGGSQDHCGLYYSEQGHTITPGLRNQVTQIPLAYGTRSHYYPWPTEPGHTTVLPLAWPGLTAVGELSLLVPVSI